jgi:hypothetical protein
MLELAKNPLPTYYALHEALHEAAETRKSSSASIITLHMMGSSSMHMAWLAKKSCGFRQRRP